MDTWDHICGFLPIQDLTNVSLTSKFFYNLVQFKLKRLKVAKKYYYAHNGAYYAEKHPDLVMRQGTIIFRKAYLKNWRKFLQNPILGFSFLLVRILETIAAVSGFIKAVGPVKFAKTFIKMFRS